MRKIMICCLLLLSSAVLAGENVKKGFKTGNPEIKSINALSFGPDGILFIGDSKSAKIFALEINDNTSNTSVEVDINQFDRKVAEILGTTADQINIEDLVVNPESKIIYFAVQHSSNTPLLMRIVDGNFEAVPLENVSYSEVSLNDAVESEATDRRGRSLRKWAISDLNYHEGQVMVTGLSNKEFGSTFRAIPFPFEENQKMSSLEIYHAAHGQFETNAPVKAFTTANMAGQDYIVAAYTCTPLVVFPTSDLKSGEHVKGRTVAELGNWNTPLDMIVLKNEGKSFLFLANSNRALMKIELDNLKDFNGSLTNPVEKRGGTAGVEFIALPFVNVQQLDKISDDTFVMLQRKSNGELHLFTSGRRWL